MGAIGQSIAATTAVFGLAGIASVRLAWSSGAKHDRHAAWRRALWAGLAATTITLLALTLTLPYAQPGETGGVNLVPFREIDRFTALLHHPAGVVNIFGNIAVFVPLGALVAWLARAPWLVRILVGTTAGALFSALIEVMQLAAGRVADIDDVILNSVGAFLGATIAVSVRRPLRRVVLKRDEHGEDSARV